MTIKQDQLNPQTTSVTFEDLHNDITATRYLHNGSDFLKCEFTDDPANPILRYYQTDGDKAAAFAMDEPNQLDLTYEPNSNSYYTVRFFTVSDNSNVQNSVDSTTITGVFRNYDNFDDDNPLFNPFNVTGPVVTRGSASETPDQLEIYRPLGNPNADVFVRSDPAGVSQGRTQIQGPFSTTLKYDMILAQTTGAEDTIFSLRHFDVDNFNERFSVGAMSSGDGSFNTLRYTIALDNTEDVAAGSFTLFQHIEVEHIEAAKWARTNGPGNFVVTVANVSGTDMWDVTTPTGTQRFTVNNAGNFYPIETSLVKFSLDNPDVGSGGGPVIGSGTDSINFTVHVDHQTFTTATGTFSISRTSGTSPVYTNHETGYVFNYNIFDFFANEDLYQDIYLYTEQFELIAATADNYVLTPSGAGIPDDAINEQVTTTTTVTRTVDRRLNIEEVDDEGNVLDTIIGNFNVLEPLVLQQITVDPYDGPATVTFSGAVSGTENLSGKVGIASDDSNTGYIIEEDGVVHSFRLDSSWYSGTTSSGSPGIVSSTTSGNALDFQFNPNSGGFLQYQTQAAGENLLRTLDISVSSGVSNSNREVFLNFPDSHILPSGSFLGDHVFLHGSDPNTLFNFRRNGDNLNVKKVDSTGTVAGLILNDSSASFITVSNVQKGDDVYISSLDQHFIVDEVLDENNLRLETAPSAASYSYRLYAGAEQIQYNIDTSLSAFASVNVDDFSLRAGTSDNTIVTAEVINAWGDPLSGKSVSFIVSNGDGAVSPANDTTDGSGEANTTYTAGVTPGPVEITATVSD